MHQHPSVVVAHHSWTAQPTSNRALGEATRRVSRGHEKAGRDRDRGVSMVEILCAIVLLGLAAAGTLGAMSASVRGSVTQRDLTNAQSWLQSAGDFLQGQQREDCDDVNGVAGEAQARIISKYQGYVRTVSNAEGWPATNVSVVSPVLYWDGDQYQSVCHDNDQINLQLVTIKVVSPNGKTTRSLQVVKGA